VVRPARVSARAGYGSSRARRFRQSHSADSATCECDTTINIYVKMVTQDAEDAMRKLETKCSLVVPQLLSEGTQLGARNEVITVQQAQPLEAVRENLAERGGFEPPLGCLFPKTV
jgi:hypothetical protein